MRDTLWSFSYPPFVTSPTPHKSMFPIRFSVEFFFFFFVHSSLAFLPLVLLATLCFSFYCCFISVLHVRKRFLFFSPFSDD